MGRMKYRLGTEQKLSLEEGPTWGFVQGNLSPVAPLALRTLWAQGPGGGGQQAVSWRLLLASLSSLLGN